MRWALPLLALAACSGGEGARNAAAPQDLESAAIERGLIRDPDDTAIAGLYARDTDRLCVVQGEGDDRIGAFVDYGEGVTCSAAGRLSRAGAALRIALGADGACSFDARFDGDRIAFPGMLPEACRKFCTGRASFAGLEVTRLSESPAEAAAMRDARGRRLCG